MSFSKFMSVVDRSAVYFARPDRLGDPFEGSFSKQNLLPGPQILGPDLEAIGMHEKEDDSPEETQIKRAAIRKFIHQYGRATNYVNCWHMNEHESAAMWNVYSRIGEGIAIQSTYQRLRDAFDAKPLVGLATISLPSGLLAAIGSRRNCDNTFSA